MYIKVISPGMLTTIQDLGRYGYQKQGVIVGGAMDSYSLRLANILAGNKETEAGLEITLTGPSLEIDKGTVFAITGGDLSPTINEEPVPMWKPVYIHEKSTLKFGICKSGCRSYLAVGGGYDIKEVMESKSTYLLAGIGGYKGRKLEKDDMLQTKSPQGNSLRIKQYLEKKPHKHSFASASWSIKGENTSQKIDTVIIRVLRDRHFKQFTLDSMDDFFSSPYKITVRSDRMGYRLSGPILKLKEHLEIISEPVCLGTIQVPPDGNPIILMSDRQTVGGYPKIAQVAAVDISKLVQAKPGDKIIFQEISLEEAEKYYIEREKYIENIRRSISLKL